MPNAIQRFFGRLVTIKRAFLRIVSSTCSGVTLRDSFVFGGLGAVGYGIWQMHPPVAWIVVGAVIFLLGVRR